MDMTVDIGCNVAPSSPLRIDRVRFADIWFIGEVSALNKKEAPVADASHLPLMLVPSTRFELVTYRV